MLDMPTQPQIGRGPVKKKPKYFYLFFTIPAIIVVAVLIINMLYNTPEAKAEALKETALEGEPKEALKALKTLIAKENMTAWTELVDIVNTPADQIKQNVKLVIETEKTAVAPDEPVRFRLKLVNNFDRNFVFSKDSPLSIVPRINGETANLYLGDRKLSSIFTGVYILMWPALAADAQSLHRTTIKFHLILIPPGSSIVSHWFSVKPDASGEATINAEQSFLVLDPNDGNEFLDPHLDLLKETVTVKIE